jgi:hypothetical protein
MAQATNSTEGTIVLGGDLAGSDALTPRLRPSGVTQGTYQVLKKASIDAKGRITQVAEVPDEDIQALVVDASASQKGIAQAGANLAATAGVLSIPDATTSVKGAVRAGAGIGAAAGVISTDASTWPQASATVQGAAKVGAGLWIDGDGKLSIRDATDSQLGVVVPGDGFFVTSGNLRAQTADVGVTGFTTAPATTANGLSYNAGTNTLSANVATASLLGQVIVGAGFAVAPDGTLTVTYSQPDASTSTKGIVQVGAGFDVAAGVLSTKVASASTAGVACAAGLLNSGMKLVGTELQAVVASTTEVGIARGDGTTVLTAGDGTLSLAGALLTPPDATTSTKGAVQVGAGLAVSSGVLSLSLPDASTSTKGIVQANPVSGLSLSAGVLSVAGVNTGGSIGGVLASSGGGITYGSGTFTLDDATTSTKGIVSVSAGNGLGVSSGVVSIAPATASVAGSVLVGSGLSASGGVLTLLDASTSVKGLVQVGTGLSVASGVISADTTGGTLGASTLGRCIVGSGLSVAGDGTIALTYGAASASTLGKISFDSARFFCDPSGAPFNGQFGLLSGLVMSPNGVPNGGADNVVTGSVSYAPQVLTAGSGIAINFNQTQVATLALTTNSSLGAPTTAGYRGNTHYVVVTQDGTGGRSLTYDSAFKTDGGAIQSAANSITVLKLTPFGSSVLLEHIPIV